MKGVSERAPEPAPPSDQEDELHAPQEPPDAASGGEHAAAASPPKVVVPRWIQLVLLPLGLLALWAIARASGKVLLLFIVAGVIALILNPAVSFLQRRRLPRGLAVLAVFLGFFLTLAGIGVLLANPISNQVKTFTRNLPTIRNEANKQIATLQRDLDKQGIHLELVKQGQTAPV